MVVAFKQVDRETGGQAGNSHKLPAAGQPRPAVPGQLVEGQEIAIADHEIVRDVETGKPTAQPHVERVRLPVLQVRGIVQRLAEGIGRIQSEAPAVMADAYLRRVVSRVGQGGKEDVIAEVAAKGLAR